MCDYLYIFIFKSLEILEEDGEIIFITPEYWFKNLHSQFLRNYILKKGHIKEIYYLGENRYFDKVNSSFVIFKIRKKKIHPKIKLFKLRDNVTNLKDIFLNTKKNFKKIIIKQFKENKKWLLFNQELLDKAELIEKSCENKSNKFELFHKFSYTKLNDIAQIANGLVSGLDKAFICDEFLYKKLNNLEKKSLRKVIKSYNLKSYNNENFQNYIFLNGKIIKNFKREYPNFYKHFQKFKKDLENRYNYSKKINYWDWVFLRSFALINSKKNKICIPCKLRVKTYENIKFSLIKDNFLLTQDVTSIYLNKEIKENIFYLLGYLNSKIIKQWIYINNNNRGNVLEFSESPLGSIPIKLINWQNNKEVKIYQKISNLTKKVMKTYDRKLVNEIDELVNLLLTQ